MAAVLDDLVTPAFKLRRSCVWCGLPEAGILALIRRWVMTALLVSVLCLAVHVPPGHVHKQLTIRPFDMSVGPVARDVKQLEEYRKREDRALRETIRLLREEIEQVEQLAAETRRQGKVEDARRIEDLLFWQRDRVSTLVERRNMPRSGDVQSAAEIRRRIEDLRGPMTKP
jgi:hypothetical protein